MYRKIAAFLFPITLIALVITAVWGYREYQDKNSILIKTENQYQRAFHDLNYHISHLEEELGKTLALNSRKQLSNSMSNVWRLAYAAQSDIGQLPMTLMPFDKAEEFVSQIGKFAFQVAVRDLDRQPLSAKERKTLETLHQRSKKISSDLASLQEKVITQNLRWMDVEQAFVSEKENLDNTIIDGFKKVNQTVGQFTEVDWGPTINNLHVHNRMKWKKLKGKKVTKQEVAQKMKELLDLPSTKGITVTLNKKGDFVTYGVHYRPKKNKEVNADVTQIGGKLVWMMTNRSIGKPQLTYKDAEQKAQQFLNRLGYRNMKVASFDESNDSIAFHFVHQVGEVRVYPESISIKVALDNGEIMGLQAGEYIFNQIEKKDQKPKLTVAQAKKEINPNLKVQKVQLAYIYNDAGQPVLCYEFIGKLGKDQYRLFLNAHTAEEEFIERVDPATTVSI